MKKSRKLAELSATYSVEKERLNLYLPKSLVDDLRRYIPERQRTQFVTDVLNQELYRIRVRNALRSSAGAWSDEAHPEMATGKDIDRWIEEGRKTLTRIWDDDAS